MSKLLQKIENDLKKALKEKNQIKFSLLRMLISDIHNEEIAKKKKGELTDEEVQEVIQRSVKRHRDSIEAFLKGGREDLVKKEKEEMEILIRYLPKQLTKEEIEKIVKEAIKKVKAVSMADLGKVMGIVMSQVKGKAEGKMVNQLVKEELGKLVRN